MFFFCLLQDKNVLCYSKICDLLFSTLTILPPAFTPTPQWQIITIHGTGSLGHRVNRVTGLPGHWVTGSQNVTRFHVWSSLHFEPAKNKPLYVWISLQWCVGKVIRWHPWLCVPVCLCIRALTRKRLELSTPN